MRSSAILFLGPLLLLAACQRQHGAPAAPAADGATAARTENLEAKALLQGVWLDSETQETVLRAEGDTIYYADETSQPAYFRIVGDSIQLGPNTYRVVKQTEHNFWFQNHAGDEVRLQKTDQAEEDDSAAFTPEEPQIISTTEALNVDSVVTYGGQRYHWYVTVNPTRYRVTRTTYTPDGVAVEKVFYDNIIHVSVFKGYQRLFSRDFNKQAYSSTVPEDFLAQSVLGNIRYSHTDPKGFHFYATVCIPDGESCYMVETLIGFDGHLTMKLFE